jgi:hypothetical protein
MVRSILDLDDPYIPNAVAAAFVRCKVQTWNKNRSTQARKPEDQRDPRFWVPYHKLGGAIYYKQSDLVRYLELNRIA